MTETIDWQGVESFDHWLDANVSPQYKAQPLAQDWARVSKGIEETGESIAELILATGQNPRKPLDPEAYARLLRELADAFFTNLYALQHFTKDIEMTKHILAEIQAKHLRRMRAHVNQST